MDSLIDSALTLAILRHNPDIVKLLLSTGRIDLNAKRQLDSKTPLTIALQENAKNPTPATQRIVQLLIPRQIAVIPMDMDQSDADEEDPRQQQRRVRQQRQNQLAMLGQRIQRQPTRQQNIRIATDWVHGVGNHLSHYLAFEDIVTFANQYFDKHKTVPPDTRALQQFAFSKQRKR